MIDKYYKDNFIFTRIGFLVINKKGKLEIAFPTTQKNKIKYGDYQQYGIKKIEFDNKFVMPEKYAKFFR